MPTPHTYKLSMPTSSSLSLLLLLFLLGLGFVTQLSHVSIITPYMLVRMYSPSPHNMSFFVCLWGANFRTMFPSSRSFSLTFLTCHAFSFAFYARTALNANNWVSVTRSRFSRQEVLGSYRRQTISVVKIFGHGEKTERNE